FRVLRSALELAGKTAVVLDRDFGHQPPGEHRAERAEVEILVHRLAGLEGVPEQDHDDEDRHPEKEVLERGIQSSATSLASASGSRSIGVTAPGARGFPVAVGRPVENGTEGRAKGSISAIHTGPSGPRTRNRWSIVTPGTQAIEPSTQRRGMESRRVRSMRRSIKSSFSLRVPGAPKGRSRSPGRRLRISTT